MAEEKRMQQELTTLKATLQKTRSNSVKLQEEYSAVMREKRGNDSKLKQLYMFLTMDTPISPTTNNSCSLVSTATSSPTLSDHNNFLK